ncbi:MAG: hypothetical protein HYY30_01240 [Chloroflexi bacterium]|nr:hypothetical protein [Chloroflexota bacterium]
MKRYEREIAELLDKMDEFIPSERPRRSKRGWSRYFAIYAYRLRNWPGGIAQIISARSLSSTTLIIACIALALLAYLLRDLFRPAAPFASIASVAFLIAALLQHAIQRRRAPEKRWRGQVIQMESYRRGRFSSLGYRWHRIWRDLWHNRKKH